MTTSNNNQDNNNYLYWSALALFLIILWQLANEYHWW